MSDDIADEVVGAEVSGVVFIRDYVQLTLEAETEEPAEGGGFQVRYLSITTYTDPIVIFDDRTISIGNPGWRDALCGLIDARVRAASASDVELRVEFDTDAVLTVSLREQDGHGPEAAMVIGLDYWVYPTV